MRLILNKCDLLSSDDLMKVYGALMWAMGKCLKSTPEVPRIYTTAFGSDADVEAALKGGAHLDGEAGEAGDEGDDRGGLAMKTPRKDGKSDNDGFNRRMRQDMRDLMKEVGQPVNGLRIHVFPRVHGSTNEQPTNQPTYQPTNLPTYQPKNAR